MELDLDGIHLISANIEGNRHLNDRVIPFLRQQKPGVVMLQEVFDRQLRALSQALGMEAVFAPMKIRPLNYRDGEKFAWGVAILSTLPIIDCQTHYYDRSGSDLPTESTTEGVVDNNAKVVLEVGIQRDQQQFNFATTHFTWTPNGQATLQQRDTLATMLGCLEGFDGVFGGDFNAPRGREIWSKIANRFKDNIPPSVTTTLERSLHRIPDIADLVVDGIWSTENYRVDQVEIHGNLSDHKLISSYVNLQKDKNR